MSTPPPSTADWVRWMARPVGRAERERAALHVLDWMACASAGSRTEPGLAMGRFARTLAPGPCATFAGPGLSEGDAALVNGSLGNVLEMDDFYRTAIVHPGPVLVPAALAMAQASGATGPQMLDALVKGFDIMIRLGRSVGPAHYRYFHNTATCGVFGAAAIGVDDVAALRIAGEEIFGDFAEGMLEQTVIKFVHHLVYFVLVAGDATRLITANAGVLAGHYVPAARLRLDQAAKLQLPHGLRHRVDCQLVLVSHGADRRQFGTCCQLAGVDHEVDPFHHLLKDGYGGFWIEFEFHAGSGGSVSR